MSLTLHRWSLLTVAALFVATTVWAAPAVPTSGDKKGESPAEKVRKALDEVTDVTLEQLPLEQALQQLGEKAKINFVIDRFTFQNMGFDLNSMEVNTKLSGVKLRSALRTILSQHNMGYAILGDTVLVTTEDMAIHRQMRQRVSVDVDKMTMAQALKQLSRETGSNLMLDSRLTKEAQTPVTLQIDDVPLDTAVKLLAHMSGLRTVRVGNVMFVTTKETADEMRQDADLVNPNPPPGVPRVEELIRPGGAGGFGFAIPGTVTPALPPMVVPAPALPPAPVPKEKDEKQPQDLPKPDEKPKQ